MTLEDGDQFEITHAQWLRETLPHYEGVWAAFIGHNRRGYPCAIAGLTEDEEADRARFFQAHYSFARALRKIADIGEQFGEGVAEVRCYKDLEDTMDILERLIVQVGRVKDMVELMNVALRPVDNFHEPLRDLYSVRSHVIHAPLMPTRIEEGLLKIPRIGRHNPETGEWTNLTNWDQIPDENFILVADFISELVQETFKKALEAHGKIFPAADNHFRNLRITPPNEQPSMSWPAGGSVTAPCISAFNVAFNDQKG